MTIWRGDNYLNSPWTAYFSISYNETEHLLSSDGFLMHVTVRVHGNMYVGTRGPPQGLFLG